jgi:hypothetical protein
MQIERILKLVIYVLVIIVLLMIIFDAAGIHVHAGR